MTTPATVERLLKAIFAARGSNVFTVQELLESAAVPKADELRAAIIHTLGRRLSVEKAQQRFKRLQGVQHGNLRLEAVKDASKSRWTYSVEQIGGGSDVMEVINALEQECKRRERNIMQKTGARFLDAVEADERRRERLDERFQREEERENMLRLNRELRAEQREEERKREQGQKQKEPAAPVRYVDYSSQRAARLLGLGDTTTPVTGFPHERKWSPFD